MTEPFTDIHKLIDFLKLDKKNRKKILKSSSFRLLLPYHLAKKIKKNDLSDPILRQFVPLIEEEKKEKNYTKDPLKEKHFQRGRLLKKYNARALLITTNACAMNCRFCFRRQFEKIKNQDFKKEIDLISLDKNLEEIIVSGGDPLALSNIQLKSLLHKLDAIPHLKRIRFHTRYILGFPNRINNEFLGILKKIKKQIIFVFHINHPIEIDDLVKKAIRKLKRQNWILLNQAVLLKDINDNYRTLGQLNSNLTEIGILPYYLHQLDKIQSTHHFDVPIEKGKELIKRLRENASGYMIPNYVKEIPNQKAKVVIN